MLEDGFRGHWRFEREELGSKNFNQMVDRLSTQLPNSVVSKFRKNIRAAVVLCSQIGSHGCDYPIFDFCISQINSISNLMMNRVTPNLRWNLLTNIDEIHIARSSTTKVDNVSWLFSLVFITSVFHDGSM